MGICSDVGKKRVIKWEKYSPTLLKYVMKLESHFRPILGYLSTSKKIMIFVEKIPIIVPHDTKLRLPNCLVLNNLNRLIKLIIFII